MSDDPSTARPTRPRRESSERSESRAGASARPGLTTWLLGAVPLVAVVELGLHVRQTTTGIVPESDWVAARELVKAELKPDDLVTFAPFWADPLGRRSFGDGIASMKREGRSDERRFARAFEVSIRGAHDPTLQGFKKVKEQHAGDVTVTLLENPDVTKVIDDLLDFVGPDRLSVSRVDGGSEQACVWQRGPTAGGSTVVPQGLLVPGDKFVCPGGHAGIAVLHGLDHHPRLCLYATPLQGATLRLRFANVSFGPSLVGHSGLQWVAERTPAPEKVSVTFTADGHLLGTHVHKVGAGWTGFEIPTTELDGKRAELVADVSPSNQRPFCFEATTRRAGGQP